jgi:hypothetical protein
MQVSLQPQLYYTARAVVCQLVRRWHKRTDCPCERPSLSDRQRRTTVREIGRSVWFHVAAHWAVCRWYRYPRPAGFSFRSLAPQPLNADARPRRVTIPGRLRSSVQRMGVWRTVQERWGPALGGAH